MTQGWIMPLWAERMLGLWPRLVEPWTADDLSAWKRGTRRTLGCGLSCTIG